MCPPRTQVSLCLARKHLFWTRHCSTIFSLLLLEKGPTFPCGRPSHTQCLSGFSVVLKLALWFGNRTRDHPLCKLLQTRTPQTCRGYGYVFSPNIHLRRPRPPPPPPKPSPLRAARKGPEYSHIENFRRKLAVLVGLIIKLSPWGDLPWDRKGSSCQSLGGRLLQERGMFS